MELDTRPGPARDKVIEVQQQWLSLLKQRLLDAKAIGEIDDNADVEQAVFETHVMLVTANFLFVISNDTRRLTQARSFSSLPDMARRLIEVGAEGLVLFNRYLEPDIDLDALGIAPPLVLSSRDELRLRLRWIAILRGQVSVSLAATGGVHLAEDVLKILLAGADVAMLASALIRHGPAHLTTLVDGIRHWLEEKGYRSIDQIKGLVSQPRRADQSAFECANYTRMITSLTRDSD